MALNDGMNSSPDRLVSVVIPVRDGAAFLAASIESVLAQTHREVDLIVIDDGSADASGDIARSFGEARVLRLEPSGLSAARNAGVRVARGAFITFHDSDDLMKPEKLERQVSFLQSHPEYDIVLTHQEIMLEPGAPRPFWARDEGAQILLPPGHGHEQAPGPHSMTMLARREAVNRVGPFAEDMSRAEDVDWIFRAFEQGVGVTSLEEELLIRRIHRHNLTQDEAESRRWLMEAFRRRIARRRATCSDR